MRPVDYKIRLRGRHSLNVKKDGSVVYSVSKVKLFTLKPEALQEMESLILASSLRTDSVAGNEVKFYDGKQVFTYQNVELYISLLRLMFEQRNVIEDISRFDGGVQMFEAMCYIELDRLDELGNKYNNCLLPLSEMGYSLIINVLVNLLTTRDSQVYYDRDLFRDLDNDEDLEDDAD